MKKLLFTLIISFITNFGYTQQAQYRVTSGNGNGLLFWNNDSYKIHMGNLPEYIYGPVTNYSIKMNMNGTAGRGWVWGVAGQTPIAALSNIGDFKLAGNFIAKKGFFEAENAAAVASVTDYLDWTRYSTALSIGKATKTNPNGFIEHRFNFTDFYETNSGLPSGSGFNIKTTDGISRLDFSAWDTGSTRLAVRNKDDEYIVQFGDYSATASGNTLGEDVNFMQLYKPGSHLSIGTWCLYKPEHELTVKGSGWFEQEIVTKSNLAVGMEAENIPSGYKLAVNGKAIATEIRVQTYANWPDFVFKSFYNLPTLEEVEQHIQEKGHLKDIPSAQEVEENGILLGEINAKLLQKIEELTLYTIKQEKEIKELKKIVEQLINDKK